MNNSLDGAALTYLAALVAACCVGWAALPAFVTALRWIRMPRHRLLGWLSASLALVLSANGLGRSQRAGWALASEPSPFKSHPAGHRFSIPQQSAPLPPPWFRNSPARTTPEVAAPPRASVPPWPVSNGSSPPRPPSRAGAGIDLGASMGETPSHHAPARGGFSSGSNGGSSRAVRPGDARGGETTFRVREGDTLWGIAAIVLRTSNPARIARYWPRIHRANRELVGPDPSLIFPGQVLDLPPETPRQ